MKYKAVIFDLFETLITECADLGIDKDRFNIYWEEKEQDRYLGNIDFEESVIYACSKCDKNIDRSTMSRIVEKRKETKARWKSCY